MPKLNHTGPEGKGPRTGRGLGLCKKTASDPVAEKFHLGKGMGEKRKSGGGAGKGRRIRQNDK